MSHTYLVVKDDVDRNVQRIWNAYCPNDTMFFSMRSYSCNNDQIQCLCTNRPIHEMNDPDAVKSFRTYCYWTLQQMYACCGSMLIAGLSSCGDYSNTYMLPGLALASHVAKMQFRFTNHLYLVTQHQSAVRKALESVPGWKKSAISYMNPNSSNTVDMYYRNFLSANDPIYTMVLDAEKAIKDKELEKEALKQDAKEEMPAPAKKVPAKRRTRRVAA